VADANYYTLLGDPSVGLPDRYYRLASDGYARWDPVARDWTPITDRDVANYLADRIFNGDGMVPSSQTEIAQRQA
jgi:hypothetical protein